MRERLGFVIGEVESGGHCLLPILTVHSDFVLIDLLMPVVDGIEAKEKFSEG